MFTYGEQFVDCIRPGDKVWKENNRKKETGF